jgi:hypothetical protein
VSNHISYNHGSRGSGGGHNMGNYFTSVSMGKFFKNLLLNNCWAKIVQIYIKAYWCSAEFKIGGAVWATLG